LRVVAVLTVREDKEVTDLRRAVSGGDPRTELPFGIELVEQRQFGRGVLELPVGGYQ
jgi:hypothetical protein